MTASKFQCMKVILLIVCSCLALACVSQSDKINSKEKFNYEPFDQNEIRKQNCILTETRIWHLNEGPDTLSIMHYTKDGLIKKQNLHWPEKRETSFEYNSEQDEILKTSFKNGAYEGKKSTTYLYDINEKMELYYDEHNHVTRTDTTTISDQIIDVYDYDTLKVDDNNHVIKKFRNSKELIDSTVYQFDESDRLIKMIKTKMNFNSERVVTEFSYEKNNTISVAHFYDVDSSIIRKKMINTYNSKGLIIKEEKVIPGRDKINFTVIEYEFCQ